MEIKEAYCSYEVSKLLKEKGFNIHCDKGWDTSVYDIKQSRNFSLHFDNKEKWISCPTHQLACAWLRNEHDIDMWVEYCIPDDAYVYTILIKDITEGFTIIHSEDNYPTYEEATEAGLKYSLENLI